MRRITETGGRASGGAVSLEPIDDRLAVRSRAESNAHYKKMYDRASALAKIGVWEYDLVTDRLAWTDGVYDIFELPRGSPIEREKAVEFYEPESRQEMERLRAEAIRTGGSFRLDILVRTAKGNDRWIHLTAEVEQEDGRSVRIFGTKQDISRRKSRQEEVRSLQTALIHVARRSAMGTMAATLAHELNQPLTAITNYAAGLQRILCAGGPDDQAQAGLAAIVGNAHRAGEIIRRMRAMDKEGEAKKEPINLRDAASDAARLGGYRFDNVLIELNMRGSNIVVADRVEVEQVLVNLIKNACEAVQESETKIVTVSSSDHEGSVKICVADSGPGVSAAACSHLFDAHATAKHAGMGIGLSICRTIVEANRGQIWAEHPERGARFCFTLPEV